MINYFEQYHEMNYMFSVYLTEHPAIFFRNVYSMTEEKKKYVTHYSNVITIFTVTSEFSTNNICIKYSSSTCITIELMFMLPEEYCWLGCNDISHIC